MSKFEKRLARLEAARKTQTEWRFLFGPDFSTKNALAAEVARLEAQGMRVWTVEFVKPEGQYCDARSSP